MSAPIVQKPPITTRQLVEYAGASGDFNRIHYDEPFAKEGGFPSVIAHGMLSMAFVGEAVARYVGDDPTRIVSLSSKFKAVTYPGDAVSVTIDAEKKNADGTASLTLSCRKQDGTLTLESEAIVR